MARAAKKMQMQGQPAPRMSKVKVVLYSALVLLLLVVIALPTMMVSVIGMLPAIVAWIIDRTPQKYATFCVGGLNFCGVFPYLLDLWSDNHTMLGASNILTDVFALAIMYGAASCGWVIFLVVPPIISSFTTVLTERRLAALQANQKRIMEDWGDDVAQSIRPPEGEGVPLTENGVAPAAPGQAQLPATTPEMAHQ